MKLFTLGVDPGATGAVSIVSPSGCKVYDFELLGKIIDVAHFRNLILPYKSDAWVFIERAQSFPGQGISSAFNYGVTYGLLLGTVIGMGFPFTEVSPAKWKKAMGINDDKDKSRSEACRIWPHMHEELKRKKDHNRAEALLLAEYGRREQVKFGEISVDSQGG